MFLTQQGYPTFSPSASYTDGNDIKSTFWEDEVVDDSSDWETELGTNYDHHESDYRYEGGFSYEDERYIGGSVPTVRSFGSSQPEVLRFEGVSVGPELSDSKDALTIETWQVAGDTDTTPHTPFFDASKVSPLRSVIEILEYHDEETYQLGGMDDEVRLCVYKDRVYRAERPFRDCEDALFAVRPRCAKDRRRSCWRRLKEASS